jgi:two-component system, NarL family, sensor histidine kinase DegS
MLKNPHFWIAISLNLLIFLIYLSFPWREIQIENSIWRAFSWLSALEELAVFEMKIHFVGTLFLLPIIYATILFKWRGAIVSSLLSIIATMFVDLWHDIGSWIINIIFLLLPVIIVVIIKVELELRTKDKLAYINEQKIYKSKVMDAQEQERKRIAQELHDDTIQTLVAIAKCAESILPSKNGYEKDIRWIRRETLNTIEELRRITLDLRPSLLDDMGLIPALRWLVWRSNEDCNTHFQIQVVGSERKLLSEVEIIIFRIVQEALNNIKHHAKANEAQIIFEYKTECIKITINDNGVGFAPPEKLADLVQKGKLGLIGVQERVQFLDGKYQIYSKQNEGTSLFIELKC